MEIYLVRHAQSKTNVGLNEDQDPELTPTGLIQAKRLGKYLGNEKFDKIYCSPAKRTIQTLDEILRHQGSNQKIEVNYTENILERNMGVYSENGIINWRRFFEDAERANQDLRYFRPENGESLQEVYERAGRTYEELTKKHEKGKILINSHELFSLCFILNALGLEPTEENFYPLPNASISKLSIREGQVTEFDIGSINHLAIQAIKES